MKILSRKDFGRMNLQQVAEFHGLKMLDFIAQVYPEGKLTEGSEVFYAGYLRWCATQTPLGQLL